MYPPLEASLRAHFMVKDMEAVRLALGLDAGWVQPINYRYSRDPGAAGLNWFNTTAGLLSFADGLGLRPLQNVQTVAEVDNYPWPDPGLFDYSSVTTLCQEYQNYAIVAPGTWCPLFCRISELCGMETALTVLLDNPSLIDAMVERITDFYVRYLTQVLDAAPGHIDIMYTGDDVTGQKGLMFSLDTWRRYFKKPYARIFQVAKERGVRVIFHSCGSVVDLIPELLDIGMGIRAAILPSTL